MSEREVVNRHFQATLTDEEYIQLRVDVARKGLTLKAWIAQAIVEKLKRLEEE